MTTTATLTERYISATIRSLRPDAQDDVRAELEAAITDAVEARVEQGEAPEAAERAVLTDLGDPGVLAAGYADRPLHLIGPRYYLTWWRLLKLLLIIVPACAAVGVAIAKLIEGAPVGDVIGAIVAVTLSVVVHVCFWVTLVFVVKTVFFSLAVALIPMAAGLYDTGERAQPDSELGGLARMFAVLLLIETASLMGNYY